MAVVYIRLILFFMLVALVASFMHVPGLEILAGDAAKLTLLVGAIVLVAAVCGFRGK